MLVNIDSVDLRALSDVDERPIATQKCAHVQVVMRDAGSLRGRGQRHSEDAEVSLNLSG